MKVLACILGMMTMSIVFTHQSISITKPITKLATTAITMDSTVSIVQTSINTPRCIKCLTYNRHDDKLSLATNKQTHKHQIPQLASISSQWHKKNRP